MSTLHNAWPFRCVLSLIMLNKLFFYHFKTSHASLSMLSYGCNSIPCYPIHNRMFDEEHSESNHSLWCLFIHLSVIKLAVVSDCCNTKSVAVKFCKNWYSSDLPSCWIGMALKSRKNVAIKWNNWCKQFLKNLKTSIYPRATTVCRHIFQA